MGLPRDVSALGGGMLPRATPAQKETDGAVSARSWENLPVKVDFRGCNMIPTVQP